MQFRPYDFQYNFTWKVMSSILAPVNSIFHIFVEYKEYKAVLKIQNVVRMIVTVDES